MKANWWAILILAAMLGCDNSPHAWAGKFVAGTWLDKSIGDRYQYRMLVCDSTQEIMGEINNNYDTSWDTGLITAKREEGGYDTLYKQFASEKAAREAVEQFIVEHNKCEARQVKP